MFTLFSMPGQNCNNFYYDKGSWEPANGGYLLISFGFSANVAG